MVPLKVIWRDNAVKFSKFFLFLHDNSPAHLAIESQKKQAYLVSQ